MSRMKRGYVAALACGALTVGYRVVAALPNDNYVLCYSPAFAGWRNFLEPCIDGVIEGANASNCPNDNEGNPTAGKPEEGWAPSFRYVFNRGVVDSNNQPVNDVVLLALAQGDANAGTLHLDLGVQVKNDKTFDNEDLVVFVFQFNNNRFGAITINPISRNGGAVLPPQSTLVGYYTASTVGADGRPVWGGKISAPNFITYAATSSGDTACLNGTLGNCNWNVEVRVNLDPNSTNSGSSNMPLPIRTYFAVSRVYHIGNSISDNATEEFAWPPTNPNSVEQLLYDNVTNAPPPEDWGPAVVNTTAGCKGIFFGPQDIIVPALQVNVQSQLQVNVHSSAIDGATGNPMSVDVQAQFLHAPFGSAAFGTFQQAGLPSSVTTVPGGSAGTPVTTFFTPSQASPHECILVTLSSTTAGATFINSGEFVNTAIAANPVGTIQPRISMVGVPPRADGSPTQRVVVGTQSRMQYAYADGGLAEIPAATLTAQLNWIFHVDRDTGRKITIVGTTMPVLDPLPSYGTTFQHPLTADFQTAFEQRHQQVFEPLCRRYEVAAATTTTCITELKARMQKDPMVARTVNAVLANDGERPDLRDFGAEVKGLNPVPNTAGALYTADIPNGGQLVVSTSANYQLGGKCLGCFCWFQSNATALIVTVLLLAVIGLIVYWRRR
ncbi:MAG TPA: hypothetical protein VKE96_18985 [Vicinamibacterales bacterium]|nr:hypothetical protein [Vicinamibacterales bacterium]